MDRYFKSRTTPAGVEKLVQANTKDNQLCITDPCDEHPLVIAKSLKQHVKSYPCLRGNLVFRYSQKQAAYEIDFTNNNS